MGVEVGLSPTRMSSRHPLMKLQGSGGGDVSRSQVCWGGGRGQQTFASFLIHALSSTSATAEICLCEISSLDAQLHMHPIL